VQRPAVPGEGEPIQGHLEGHLRGAGPAGERKGEYEVIYPSSTVSNVSPCSKTKALESTRLVVDLELTWSRL
jgi:hypothetical protein